MSMNGKWILRPGKRPIVPEAAKPKTASQQVAEREAKTAVETKPELKPKRQSPKFGADRRAAFLKAYRQGGDAQGAAKAVMVPWSAIKRTLEADAAFRADYETAKTVAHTDRYRGALQVAVSEVGALEAAALVGALEVVSRNRNLAHRLRDRRLALEMHAVDGLAVAKRLILNEVLIGDL